MTVQKNEAIEPEVMPDLEPSWERARQMLKELGGWEKIYAFGQELTALKNQYFRVRQGTRTDLFPHAEKGSPRPSVTGWCETVRREIGMTPQAAYRAMDRGVDSWKLHLLESGKGVDYVVNYEIKRAIPDAAMSKRAAAALLDVCMGGNAGRAFAGVVGESNRQGKNGTPDRAEINHAYNLRSAMIKIRNSLKYWAKLSPKDRANLETLWSTITLPATWKN